ncbi:DNA-directed RNA polymerase I subunit RPA34.5-domain-containing protein [Aspergillus granulosus]|uniref:DNA-directed RNA polymerase I subunit RPA34.5-domain-containing protein n=1 Tax=Aspergillus granulosus TaxID=176169 RepID=A0ABR4H1M2_9EURO
MAAKAEKQSKSTRAQRSESESSSSAESNSKAEESSTSGSEEEQSSNSASESESDNENATAEKAPETSNGHSEFKTSQARTIRPPQPYKPPSGFKSTKNQSSISSTPSILSDLQGKQVFHITAPAYLPLSKIKEVSLARAMKGEPIMEHEGIRYGIPVDSLKHATDNGQTLFLYDSKAKTYRSATANVPTYHIQETIELPGGAEYEEASVQAAKALEKPPRKQPKNLKMRFRPVGSGDGPPQTLGSSDEESEEEPTFKVPPGVEKEKERKRKHQSTEGDSSQSAGLPRKKSKKHSADNVDNAVEEKVKKSKDRDGRKRKKAEKA